MKAFYYPYESEQFYINNYVCLWKLNESNQLLNGEYWFPFKFIIPSNAPSNVNEKCGHVEYYVKGEIEFNGKPCEFQYYGFSVCPLIDLNNLDPKLKLSASTEITQNERKCFSCTKNPLNVKITLPKTGFVCGETIPIKLEINNKTSMKIKSIEYGIELKCLYVGTFIPSWSSMSRTANVDTSTDVAVITVKDPSNSGIYNYVIPPLSPTFTDCSFLKLEYSIFVKVHTNAFFQSGPSFSIPITIGTVPLKNSESEETLNAMEILESANFMEGVNRCTINDYIQRKQEGPNGFLPKFACYSVIDKALILLMLEEKVNYRVLSMDYR
uniref:Arrestin C-terminal-like domain-containing protein n=1 Tax=Panagrolaimus davidi TaxID=227884 RepID=A0A914Q506_9BILA